MDNQCLNEILAELKALNKQLASGQVVQGFSKSSLDELNRVFRSSPPQGSAAIASLITMMRGPDVHNRGF